MSQLDDRAWVTRLDPRGMLALFEQFPQQCRDGLAIGQAIQVEELPTRPSVVCLTGMGGSAAGGDFVRALFDAYGTTPFIVNRDYHLPHYIGVGDVVFCASYSGNTEETLSAYADAKRSGAKVIVVTTGGKLAYLANADGFAAAIVPGGLPPRAALGYMLMPVLAICQKLKLLPEFDYDKAFKLTEACIQKWTVENTTGNAAKALAAAAHGKLALLYGLGSWQGLVANRWKAQINENAKNIALANAFPELNHNEILGWVGAREQGVANWVIIVLQDGHESLPMKERARITAHLVGNSAEFYDAFANGESLLERMLTLLSLGDFVSIYLAALNAVDPENIDYLNRLKTELAKVSS